MRRAPIVLTATVAGTAAVLGFHTHPAALPTASASASSTASSTASAATASSSSTSGSSTVTGDAMNTRYGPAQVQVTISGGKITDIQAVQLQNADPKSASISGYAAPIIVQEALSSQTAAVSTVSGATYTSVSLEASLQSALDKAGFTAADGSTASTDVSMLG